MVFCSKINSGSFDSCCAVKGIYTIHKKQETEEDDTKARLNTIVKMSGFNPGDIAEEIEIYTPKPY